MLHESVLIACTTLFGILGWLLYFQADEQRRDLLTDMAQLLHDEKISRDDLRRARDHDEIEDAAERID